jgi:hypothetical protein
VELLRTDPVGHSGLLARHAPLTTTSSATKAGPSVIAFYVDDWIPDLEAAYTVHVIGE